MKITLSSSPLPENDSAKDKISKKNEAAESAGNLEMPGDSGSENISLSPSAEYLIRIGRTEATSAESVIGGSDERARILDTQLKPWCMICNLLTVGPRGAAQGTGFLIGPRTVLTAGHCVYDKRIGGWASRVTVTPGMNRERTPFGSVIAKRFSAPGEWTGENNDGIVHTKEDCDFGVIHLDHTAIALDAAGAPILHDGSVDQEATALGKRLGWFGMAVKSDDDLRNRYVHVAGYPADRDKGLGRELWSDRSYISLASPLRLFYSLDTTPGQSGGPAFIVDDDPTRPIVVAIHAYGEGASPPGLSANSSPRITTDRYEAIKHWIEKGPEMERS